MAYNVLKGKVEGSVDQHADQEIDGVKVFKNTVSASVFYDTDANAPCVTAHDVGITKLNGSTKTGLLTITGDKTATVHHNLKFNGEVVTAPVVHARKFIGSGEGLTNVPVNQFSDAIPATFISLGSGLHDVRGKLQPNTGAGMSIEQDKLTIDLSAQGGLSTQSGKLAVDPSAAPQINSSGQNLSDGDFLLIADVSRGAVHRTSLQNLYDSYINNKIPHASGNLSEIQIKGKKGFTSSRRLTYDLNTETLKVQGTIAANSLNVEDSLTCAGAIVKNIAKITTKSYEVAASDYTLICDTVKNPITVIVPPACNHTGRVIVVKKANTDKYNLRSYPVCIKTLEGTIDLNDEHVIKTNYSARTLQSDGENWLIIGSKGS